MGMIIVMIVMVVGEGKIKTGKSGKWKMVIKRSSVSYWRRKTWSRILTSKRGFEIIRWKRMLKDEDHYLDALVLHGLLANGWSGFLGFHLKTNHWENAHFGESRNDRWLQLLRGRGISHHLRQGGLTGLTFASPILGNHSKLVLCAWRHRYWSVKPKSKS